jgi:flavodoxin
MLSEAKSASGGKRFFSVLFVLAVLSAAALPLFAKEKGGAMKTLVIYYSLTGKTELVAQEIAKELNADLRKVEDLKKPSIAWAYFYGGYSAMRGKEWKIKPVDLNLSGYDRIFVGSPVWAGKPAPAVNTVIASIDFTGKTVIPFVTMGGSGGDRAIKAMSDKITTKGGKIAGSFSIKSGGKKNEEITAKAHELIKQFAK